jgi:hypothetical protein
MTHPREQSTATTAGPLPPVQVAYRVALALFLVMGAVQIFLAGLGAFSTGGDPGFGPHRVLGFAMAGVALVIVVLAVVARVGGRAVGLAVLLFLLTAVGQSLLAALGEDIAVVGGLHALDGLVILGLAGYLQGAARRGLTSP